MKHLILLIVAALLLGACQKEQASTPEVSDPLVSTNPESTTVAADDEGSNAEANNADIVAKAIDRALGHPERPQADRDRDEFRHPAEVLAFAGIRPGMCVLDVFTAGGYYAEVLSRVVGEEGEVWAQNPPQFYERFGSADLDFRLADRRLPNVERQDRPMEDLALPEERFDAVVAALVFHDLFWLTDDVPAVLKQLYDAMRPGGVLLVTDHNAPPGTKAEYAMDQQGKHRVEDQYVTQILSAAGFELVDTNDVLSNPEDDRSMAFFEPEMRGKRTDRFVHLYRKPG